MDMSRGPSGGPAGLSECADNSANPYPAVVAIAVALPDVRVGLLQRQRLRAVATSLWVARNARPRPHGRFRSLERFGRGLLCPGGAGARYIRGRIVRTCCCVKPSAT